jgi:hypothetical protein
MIITGGTCPIRNARKKWIHRPVVGIDVQNAMEQAVYPGNQYFHTNHTHKYQIAPHYCQLCTYNAFLLII